MAASRRDHERFLFAVITIGSALFLAAMILYPRNVDLIYFWLANEVILTRPFMWLVLIGILATAAILILGAALTIYQTVRQWYYRRTGTDYRTYDDPARQD